MSVFKSVFGRLRPDTAYSEIAVSGLGLPGGHATMSAAVFSTLGALVESTRSRWTARDCILSAAATLTILVGVSRVVPGVRWTTDLAAGWAFGIVVRLLVARRVSP